ncbi:MAG: tRNA (adenosine(37)-N6)-dimethylallyltransferase MiaA [Bacteroidaceae bacterium]|nr:tRNA (adenosine(37)-N6)-dimethylallyltransferase MiaA [Bacteroidaceae bacterium]
MQPTLIVLLGPTAVGKTALSLRLANELHAPIVSADSRQLYRGMEIGTAAPTAEERACAPHHFVGELAPDQYCSAAWYEEKALQRIQQLMEQGASRVLLCGGSMLYIDAVCKGIDLLPTIPDEVREAMRERLHREGLDALRHELQQIDPDYYARCDLQNARRIIHALEVYYTARKPYSTFLTGQAAKRPFHIVKIGLQRPREELFERIAQRVALMLQQGLVDEARRLSAYRYCNALNTVGYKEVYKYLDGEWDMAMTQAKIARNTRVYAKKQMTWFQRDNDIHWYHPDDEASIVDDLHRYLARLDNPC